MPRSRRWNGTASSSPPTPRKRRSDPLLLPEQRVSLALRQAQGARPTTAALPGGFGRMADELPQWPAEGVRRPGGARKSVVSGKSVSVRVDPGGCRIIQKQTYAHKRLLV